MTDWRDELRAIMRRGWIVFPPLTALPPLQDLQDIQARFYRDGWPPPTHEPPVEFWRMPPAHDPTA